MPAPHGDDLGGKKFIDDASFMVLNAPNLTRGAGGMGTRSKRYSMLVEDGVVKQLNREQPGKFEVSDAATLLKQL